MKKILIGLLVIALTLCFTCCDDNSSVTDTLSKIGQTLEETKVNSFVDLEKTDDDIVEQAKAEIKALLNETKDILINPLDENNRLTSEAYEMLQKYNDLFEKYGNDPLAWSAIISQMKYETVKDYPTNDQISVLNNKLTALTGIVISRETNLITNLRSIVKITDYLEWFADIEAEKVLKVIKVPTAKSASYDDQKSYDLIINNYDPDKIQLVDNSVSIKVIGDLNQSNYISSYDNEVKTSGGSYYLNITLKDNNLLTSSKYIQVSAQFKIKKELTEKFLSWTDTNESASVKTITWTLRPSGGTSKQKTTIAWKDQPIEEISLDYNYDHDGYYNQIVSILSSAIKIGTEDGKGTPVLKYYIDTTEINETTSLTPGKYKIKAQVEEKDHSPSSLTVPLTILSPTDMLIGNVKNDVIQSLVCYLVSFQTEMNENDQFDIDSAFANLLSDTYGFTKGVLYIDFLAPCYLTSLLDSFDDIIDLLSKINRPFTNPYSDYNDLSELSDCLSISKLAATLSDSSLSNIKKGIDNYRKDPFTNKLPAGNSNFLAIRNLCYSINNISTLLDQNKLIEKLMWIVSCWKYSFILEERVVTITDDGINFLPTKDASKIVTDFDLLKGFLQLTDEDLDQFGLSKTAVASMDLRKLLDVENQISGILPEVKIWLAENQYLQSKGE